MSGQTDAARAPGNDALRWLAPLQDIPLQITVEIGRMKLKVRDLLKLAPNHVLEIRKPAGEPLDICVNGRCFARGEVIVVDQTSTVRIIEILKVVGSPPGVDQA